MSQLSMLEKGPPGKPFIACLYLGVRETFCGFSVVYRRNPESLISTKEKRGQ